MILYWGSPLSNPRKCIKERRDHESVPFMGKTRYMELGVRTPNPPPSRRADVFTVFLY